MKYILIFLAFMSVAFADTLNTTNNTGINIGALVQDDKSLLSNISKELPSKKIVTEIKKSDKNKVEKVLDEAFKLLGIKYVWGAIGPDKFDCSGFVLYVVEKSLNIKLPRISSDMAAYKDDKLNFSELQRGDLIFFDTLNKGRVSHVGIYIGENKFIHASSGSKTKKVVISEFDTYYKSKFKWGIRL